MQIIPVELVWIAMGVLGFLALLFWFTVFLGHVMPVARASNKPVNKDKNNVPVAPRNLTRKNRKRYPASSALCSICPRSSCPNYRGFIPASHKKEPLTET